MTTGIPFLYSEYSNSLTEKGICHVNEYIHFSQSDPDSSRACYWADHHFGYCSNYRFCLDSDRPRYRTSRFEDNGLALELLCLPMPILA
jgi:hypothetical protein